MKRDMLARLHSAIGFLEIFGFASGISTALTADAKLSAAAIILLFQIVGCAQSPPLSPISQATLNTIAECNAGYGISTGATLSAKIELAAQSGLALNAAASKELRGLLLNSDLVTANNIESIYKAYLGCINNSRSVDELLAIIGPRHEAIMEDLQDSGLTLDAEKFDAAYNQYVDASKLNQRVAAHEALSRIYRILAAASINVPNTKRASADFRFSYDPRGFENRLDKFALKESKPTESDLKTASINRCLYVLTSSLLDLDGTIDKQAYCKSEFQGQLLLDQLDPCNNPQTPEQINKCIAERSK